MPEVPNSPATAETTAETTEASDVAEASASSPIVPITIVMVEKDDAPNAIALQFVKSFRVVFFVRKGRETSDEDELRKQIIANEGAPLLVSMNGSPKAKVFDTPEEPGCYFRILAVAK